MLSNAYRYSPEGGAVSIGLIKAAALERGGRSVGTTPAQLARVSERFYRADNSGKMTGTGLGMSHVKEIIEWHGGKMARESPLGAGSTVA